MICSADLKAESSVVYIWTALEALIPPSSSSSTRLAPVYRQVYFDKSKTLCAQHAGVSMNKITKTRLVSHVNACLILCDLKDVLLPSTGEFLNYRLTTEPLLKMSFE